MRVANWGRTYEGLSRPRHSDNLLRCSNRWEPDEPEFQFTVAPEETTSYILDLYRSECDRSRAHVAGASLDERCRAKSEWIDGGGGE